MTVADLIVRQLLDAGVRAVFGVPGGGGNLDLIAAMGRSDLPFVLTSTETAAAFAALAQAEVTGRPGVCLTTLGPGAASVTNGVACAWLERAPLLVFTDSLPASTLGRFAHQRLDHAGLLGSVAKRSATLAADTAAETVWSALAFAVDGRPGPVHLDCPGDVLQTSAQLSPLAPAGSAQPRLLQTEASAAGALLARATRPLLLVGLGARRPEDAAAIRGFCERHRVPALVTYKAKGVVPDDHAWFAGVLTNAAIERPVIDQSDLLIGVGLDPVELLPRAWPPTPPVVYCGRWPVETGHVPCVAQIITEIPAALDEIGAALGGSSWQPGEVRSHVDAQRRAIDIEVPAGALSAQRVVEVAVARLASVAGHVTVDAGAHMFPATVLWPVDAPNRMLISNGLSTMGFALPAAIGAACLDRERPAVALTGDGGLLMCLGELLTAVRERLRLIVIVFNDASLSLIEIKQQARHLEPAGVALGDVAWPALARSLGLQAWTASTEAALDQAIGEALPCTGPCLIEARIDRSNYGAMLRAVRG